jgi:hypothetical protein
LYFEGLYQIIKLLFAGTKAKQVREAVVQHYQIKTTSSIRTQRPIPILSKFDVTERRLLLQMASLLLNNWPNGFIEFCQTNNLWLKSLYHKAENRPNPYWYWKITHEYLDRSVYVKSEQEFASAITYLRKMGREPKRFEMRKFFGTHAFERLRLEKPKPRIKDHNMKCPSCSATKRQRKSGCYKYTQRFNCGMCNRSYTPRKELPKR